MAHLNDKSITDFAYDDIEVGQNAQFNAVVTQEKVESFCELTGDFHPLHCDEGYAKESGFDGILAHGLLSTSFASKLIGMHLPGKRALVVSQSFDYIQPVYLGDALTVRGVVTKKIDLFSMILVEVTIHNQSREQVSKGSFKVKLRPA